MQSNTILFDPNFQFKIDFDYSVEDNLETFKEEVLNHLYDTHKTNGEMPLLFSGGMDSTFLLRSLLELGIKPKLLTMSFSKNNNSYECNLVKNRCEKYGIKDIEFFYMDDKKVLGYINHLIYDKNIAYPMLHGFYLHYLLEKFSDQKFFSGMGSEFKLFKNIIKFNMGPCLVKQNNPNRLFDFSSSRTFLSYINSDTFLSNINLNYTILPAELQARPEFYVRDEIYIHCYPDIDRALKTIPLDTNNIVEPFVNEIIPVINERFPSFEKAKAFYFNIDEYFNRKN
jgi:hypothetical protein